MNLAALAKNKIIFTTRGLAFEARRNISSVSRSLSMLDGTAGIVKVTRGVWANTSHPYFSAYAAVPYLLDAEQGYVSFLSALQRHGVISQIPSVIQIATTGRNRTVFSKAGNFEFIRLSPKLMRSGFGSYGDTATYNMASPEKALFDCVYISTRKNKRFGSFPEIELEEIDLCKIADLIAYSDLPDGLRTAIQKRMQKIGGLL